MEHVINLKARGALDVGRSRQPVPSHEALPFRLRGAGVEAGAGRTVHGAFTLHQLSCGHFGVCSLKRPGLGCVGGG